MARELSLLVHFHVDVIEVLFLVYLKFRILEVLTRGDRACNLKHYSSDKIVEVSQIRILISKHKLSWQETFLVKQQLLHNSIRLIFAETF